MKLFRGQPDHEHWRRPITSGEKASVWGGLGLVFLLLGATSGPSAPPFTGRWALVSSAFYSAFGPQGPPRALLGLGALCLLIALGLWWQGRHGEKSR